MNDPSNPIDRPVWHVSLPIALSGVGVGAAIGAATGMWWMMGVLGGVFSGIGYAIATRGRA